MTNSQKPAGDIPADEEIRSALKKTKWGKTVVTDFLNKADMNTRITYLKLQGYFEMLDGVGDIFFKAACENIGYSDESGLFTLLLLGRSYGNYFAAVRLSSSGQLPETYAQLRVCTENALYAFNIYSDPKLAQVWRDRRKDKKSRGESVTLFRPSTIMRKLEEINQSLGQNIKTDYERYIDFGAHPNEASVGLNLNVSGRKLSHLLLNTTEGVFQGCLSECVMCGLNAIKIFNLIYPDDFKKFNTEERIQAIEKQFNRIAPWNIYKLRQKSP